MSSTPNSGTEISTASAELSAGFPPVSRADARLLILGSLPGTRSLAKQEYYGHPQNAFWPIMKELVGACGTYAERCQHLRNQRIAVWDVLASSIRPGSMDADIDIASARPNDFLAFFDTHPEIERIGFNGQKSAQLFRRFIGESLDQPMREHVVLPSTSPAYASMSRAEKIVYWRAFVEA